MSRVFEPGNYKAVLTKVSYGKSKEKGTPQVTFGFMPQGIMKNGRVEPCPQFERAVFKYITENTVDYVVQDLEKLGYDRGNFDELDSTHPNAFPFVGLEINVYLEYETYQGKEKERWNFSRDGGLKNTPMEKSEAAKVNAMFAAKLRKPSKPAPQQPAMSSTTQQAEETF